VHFTKIKIIGIKNYPLQDAGHEFQNMYLKSSKNEKERLKRYKNQASNCRFLIHPPSGVKKAIYKNYEPFITKLREL
jgi:hypothetical protein